MNSTHHPMGEVDIPDGARWGSQTARSLRVFAVGQQRMPLELIRAMALIKAEAAQVNGELGLLGAAQANAICRAAQRVAEGEFEGQFPLPVWQPGSGAHSHTNVNEVVAQLARESLPAQSQSGVDAHADVSCGQAAHDVFPSAMHIAVALQMKARLLPAVQRLQAALLEHAQFTRQQELGGYAAQLASCEARLWQTLPALHRLSLCGSADSPVPKAQAEFAAAVTVRLAKRLQLPLLPAESRCSAVNSHEALLALHAGLRMLALVLSKIAGSMRLLGRATGTGLGGPELDHPVQLEVLTMVCAQVMGHDTAIGFAASQGLFELNTCEPMIALNVLDSIRLLADGMQGFAWHCVSGQTCGLEMLPKAMEDSLLFPSAAMPLGGFGFAASTSPGAAGPPGNGPMVREPVFHRQGHSAGAPAP